MSVKIVWDRTIKYAAPILTIDLKFVGLVYVLLMGAYFRVLGLGAGLPLVWNGDEVFMVEHALAISANDLNTHAQVWGSLPFYVIRIAAWVANATTAPFGHTLMMSDYYLLARWLSAGFGILTIGLVFVLGRRVAGDVVGLASAAIFAFSPLAIELSHYATVESELGFWAVLSLVGMVLWLKGNERGSLVAGLGVGFAIACKYNAALLFVPILLIALQLECARRGEVMSRQRKLVFAGLVLVALMFYSIILLWRDQLLALAAAWTSAGQLQPIYIEIANRILVAGLVVLGSGILVIGGMLKHWHWAEWIARTATGMTLLRPLGVAIVAFVFVSPFAILDFPGFAQGLFYSFKKQTIGGAAGYTYGTIDYVLAVQDTPPSDPFYYLRTIMSEWGILATVLLLIGLVVLWRRHRNFFLPLVSVVVVGISVSSLGHYAGARYVYFLWGPIALLVGLGIGGVLAWSNRREWLRVAMGTGIISFVFVSSMYFSYNSVSSRFLLPDTRNLVLNWVKENVAPSTFILRDLDTPEIERANYKYRVEYSAAMFERATLAEWQYRGVGLIIMGISRPQFYQAHPENFRNVLTEYENLQRNWRLVKTFEAGNSVKGPTIYVYAAP